MAAFKYFDPYAEIQKQEGSVATVATVATHSASEPKSVAGLATVAGGNRENVNPLPAICIFCRQPVGRGTPGTGALAGNDLHMDCYWKRYPNGHQKDHQNPAS
jgi:hypothetical protein